MIIQVQFNDPKFDSHALSYVFNEALANYSEFLSPLTDDTEFIYAGDNALLKSINFISPNLFKKISRTNLSSFEDFESFLSYLSKLNNPAKIIIDYSTVYHMSDSNSIGSKARNLKKLYNLVHQKHEVYLLVKANKEVSFNNGNSFNNGHSSAYLAEKGIQLTFNSKKGMDRPEFVIEEFKSRVAIQAPKTVIFEID